MDYLLRVIYKLMEQNILKKNEMTELKSLLLL
jgi:hypothetical protein